MRNKMNLEIERMIDKHIVEKVDILVKGTSVSNIFP